MNIYHACHVYARLRRQVREPKKMVAKVKELLEKELLDTHCDFL